MIELLLVACFVGQTLILLRLRLVGVLFTLYSIAAIVAWVVLV